MKIQALGKPLSRRDGVLKVTGQADFSAEHHLPNLAHAAVVFSTIPKGQIQKIETAQAEKYPGVLAVITHKNSPHLKKTPSFNPSRPDAGSSGTDAPILGDNVVHWNGFPIAIVVAETQDQAEAAAQLVEVSYKSQSAALTMEGERDNGNAYTPKTLIQGEPSVVDKGDAKTALSQCAVMIGATYRTPPYNHNPIEPHATVAHWEDDCLTVYDATQYIVGVRNTLAAMFALKQEKVRVFSPFVGGAVWLQGQHVAPCAALRNCLQGKRAVRCNWPYRARVCFASSADALRPNSRWPSAATKPAKSALYSIAVCRLPRPPTSSPSRTPFRPVTSMRRPLCTSNKSWCNSIPFPTPSCARRANRLVLSRWNRRWTS